MGSVFSLVPKVPRKDMHKLLINDGSIPGDDIFTVHVCLTGKVLRFSAKFSNPEPEDVSRR